MIELSELLLDGERVVAEKSYGYEYMTDEESSGYPIEPILHFVRNGQNAYLIDNAGIIWHANYGVFYRYCKGACLAYIKTYWNNYEADHADNISSFYHKLWMKQYDN